jgi:medium-chain acyl-[acyl-carrier-protein] hydrolase
MAPASNPAVARWLPFARPSGERSLALFCFAHAGGGASVFLPWRRAAPASLNIIPVQIPGHETRMDESPHRSVAAIAHAAADALEPHLSTPYALFGHSFGALIAFELTRVVSQRRLHAPVHLFLSGAAPPRRRVLFHYSVLLPDRLYMRWLARRGAIPREILQDTRASAAFVHACRADLGASRAYRIPEQAEPDLTCPISAYGGCRDPLVSEAGLRRWHSFTKRRFLLRMFEGSHFFLGLADQVVAQITTDLGSGAVQPARI